MIKHFFSRMRTNHKGQSFVELMLVTLILAFALSGVVEFGYLLNSYLKVLDGAREGARYSNNGIAFECVGVAPCTWVDRQDFYVNTAIQTLRVMSPVRLNGNRHDDIVISVFSVTGDLSTIVRWPDGRPNGWNVCDNRLDLTSDLVLSDWSACVGRPSHFTTMQVRALMDPLALESGIVLVEVYYNYPQILKLPVFTQLIPDPIPVYAYAMMPLASARPTPTPH